MTDAAGEQPATTTEQTTTTPPPAQAAGATETKQKDVTGKAATALDASVEDKPAPADWPADWRELMADKDEKYLNKLKRYSSPLEYSKSYREMEKLVSSRGKPLGENPTPEELSRYRKENGIPEKHTDYDLKFDDGLVIGEADKPAVDMYLKAMHGKNVSPAVVKEGLRVYLTSRDAQILEFQKQEKAHREETTEALRSEWGAEFKQNLEMVKSFLGKAPDGIGDMLMNARDGTGRALFNTPAFAKWMVSIVRDIDPTGPIAHSAGGSGVSLQERKEQIQKIIRDTPEQYFKGEAGMRLQNEMSAIETRLSKGAQK